MPKIIALAGKGGVGKTTVGGILIRYLVEEMRVGPVLAVDGDPNSNLNEILGVKVISTIGQARELMKKDVPTGMTKDVWFEYKVHEAITEGRGFDLLVMGRPEGPGCYCAANSLAKQSIEALKGNYPYVVVDNEAGMEHMSRLVTQDVDYLYVISDPTPRGLLTSKRIVELIGELKLTISHSYIVINRVRGKDKDRETLLEMAREKGLTITGLIGDDEGLSEADAEGKSVFELPGSSVALTDAYGIFRETL
ncbi:MAG: AAA family ATPase [Syntrophorhabdus aromaticivorans]|uniref:AAA family ATPase n=1 Tax=Syntrophorhabdus aromaticivorans TaxID=328301 RepID=A0A351TYW1_9BACT|nr:AAA family ATPase [Syntrophorhabdus aromaticivorans]HBA52892.1 carbon monoxide dehydrogenase [Syntrophorhabdus aromaticivorans]